jgi:hypothetical protein
VTEFTVDTREVNITQRISLMFNYLFITNKPDLAAFAEACGVSRIFIDLEYNGKVERQGHLDTVISRHCFTDISTVKAALSSSELLVRLNPFYDGSELEVNRAIEAGADILMLPMCRTIEEIDKFGSYIAGRARFIPLIETVAAANIINNICELDCVDEIHIGLNDLHMELQYSFMFELLANGYVDSLVGQLSKPFGIGGIARIGEGTVPGELVMSEHVRLKSSSVILSRAFHLRAQSLDELRQKIDLNKELVKLNECRKVLLTQNDAEKNYMREKFISAVNEVTGIDK